MIFVSGLIGTNAGDSGDVLAGLGRAIAGMLGSSAAFGGS